MMIMTMTRQRGHEFQEKNAKFDTTICHLQEHGGKLYPNPARNFKGDLKHTDAFELGMNYVDLNQMGSSRIGQSI